MKVCVIVPEEYMGDVIGDLNSRRGQIQGMEAAPAPQQIDALCTAVRDVRLRHRPALAKRRAAASTPWSPATTLSCPRASRRS